MEKFTGFLHLTVAIVTAHPRAGRRTCSLYIGVVSVVELSPTNNHHTTFLVASFGLIQSQGYLSSFSLCFSFFAF